jgi:RimJ/RimL family protein N-acetyltransferase
MTSSPAPTLDTERLLLRGFTLDDAPAFHAGVTADPDVMRFLPGGVPRSLDRTVEMIATFDNGWRERRTSGLAVVYKANGQVIGQVGLWPVTPSDGGPQDVEVFYALAKAYWGQGLAAEAARAMIAYGFEQAGLNRIVAVAYPENTASQRVMQKLGMRDEGLSSRYYNTEMALFSLSRDAWQAAQAPAAGS